MNQFSIPSGCGKEKDDVGLAMTWSMDINVPAASALISYPSFLLTA